MSLFKLKNLWAQSYSEEFDSRHMCVGRIDNLTAVGLASFAGTVRIHQVFAKSPLKVDLIYENTFDSPAIAI